MNCEGKEGKERRKKGERRSEKRTTNRRLFNLTPTIFDMKATSNREDCRLVFHILRHRGENPAWSPAPTNANREVQYNISTIPTPPTLS